ncbi:MAG: tryptophan--tRNA ligase [Candidatus Omnitrophota bacterium]|nr:tryptophan--tRNA ligase [Candidatus Omnitrophota bacterium]
MKKRILSGMRPTGKLHLGHLFGALENWKSLQEEYECFFMVADWHALMSEYASPAAIQENIIDNVSDWLACGISGQKAVIFVQSQVPQHLELFMIFSIITPLGLLERCPTYKEQLREIENRDLSTYGFLGYPVLQAADILLYKAQAVPVGVDQLPHLELTRSIARKFKNLYKKDIFGEPQALLTQANRFPGLDGRKMSKSYGNYIGISEAPDSIQKKVQSMFTDPARIKLSDPGHPDKCNVHAYYALFYGSKKEEIESACRASKIGCTECKRQLAEALVKFLEPMREKKLELLKDKKKIYDILAQGQKKAQAAAAKTLSEVKELIGI